MDTNLLTQSPISVTRHSVISSSVDPNRLSLGIQGLFTMLIPIIIAIGQEYDIKLTETQLVDTFKAIVAWVSAFWIVWGGVRKVHAWFKSK
jgi:hypothetical protein